MNAAPPSLLTAALVFAGVSSSLAADAGYVVLIPLGAVVFAAVGRHPLAGLSATFAGVAGGFSANLLPTSLDPLLIGFTEAAAQMVDADYTVSVTSNYYFMIGSTVYLTVLGTIVCERFVEPRLGKWQGDNAQNDDAMHQKLTDKEKKGLIYAGVVFVICLGILAFISIPEGALLRDANGELKPLEHSIVFILMMVFLLCGVAYSVAVGTAKNDKDVAVMASDGMATMGGYIVLSFAMAQFINYFKWSNLASSLL